MKTKISLITLTTSIITFPIMFIIGLFKRSDRTKRLLNFNVLAGFASLFYLVFSDNKEFYKNKDKDNDNDDNCKVEKDKDVIKFDNYVEDEKKYVFLTKTGSKFHQVGCRHLGGSNLKTTKKLALDDGLTPCGVCKP